MADLPEAPRVQPVAPSVIDPGFAAKLISKGVGFFHFDVGPRNSNCYFVSAVRRDIWACVLSTSSPMTLELDFSIPFHQVFKPLREVLASAGINCLTFGVVVESVELKFLGNRGAIARWEVLGVSVVDAPPVGSRARKVIEEAYSESEADQEKSGESGASSLHSDEDSVDGQLSSSSADGGDAEAAGNEAREARGNLVVYKNDYFTLVRIKQAAGGPLVQARIYIAPKLRTAESLGSANTTKTIMMSRLDGNLDPPLRTFAALKAWMLWRACSGGWARAKPVRAIWLNKEAEELKRHIRAMDVSGGGTGHAEADTLITEWWPAALE